MGEDIMRLIRGGRGNIQFAFLRLNQTFGWDSMYSFRYGQVVEEPLGVTNQLWISGQLFAHNLHALAQHGITAVCSLGSDTFSFPRQLRHLYLEVEDRADEDITPLFEVVYDFIEENRKCGNVLVHCVAGVSRSSAMVVYYLMRRHGWTLQRSLQALKRSREVVRPNVGFLRQLGEAEGRMGLGRVFPRF